MLKLDVKIETVKLGEGERIDVVKDEIGYSIIGPALIVVVKEKPAEETADTLVDGYKFVNGVAVKETE